MGFCNSAQDIQSPISNYYAGRSLFVTGGTGFMGKVLLEKLLRACPEIQKIYVLVRTKRGANPQDRLKQILEGRLYTPLTEASPNVLKKVIAVSGDVTQPNLGMSPEDEEIIINDVSVIFHVAATVKFDDELPNAIRMNVKGTLSIVDLARKIKYLSALVHISTAYVHCYKEASDTLEEKFYPMPSSKYGSSSPDELITLFEEAKLEGRDMTKEILGIFPNTYIFTKAWAENVLSEKATDLPLVIMRPSIVVASWKEPIPGWVDNLNGPTGMLAAGGVGLMQTIYAKKDKKADLMPVDIACNMMCALGWKVGTQAQTNDTNLNKDIQIYNCTSGSTIPVNWGQLERGLGYMLKYPLENMLWYPYACSQGLMSPMKNYKLEDRVCRVLFHWIPAYTIDTFCYIARIKNTSRVKLVTRMQKAMGVLEYFSTREWDWDTKNVATLYNEVSYGDQNLYNFSLKNFEDWDPYFESTMKGTREFAMKSDPKTIDECRKKLKKFYVANQIMKLMFLGMLYLLFSRLWQVYQQ